MSSEDDRRPKNEAGDYRSVRFALLLSFFAFAFALPLFCFSSSLLLL